VKILADAKTDRVLGVHIIGAEAGEMIHEAAVCEWNSAVPAEDLARTCHAHPTRSEAVKEAALAVANAPSIFDNCPASPDGGTDAYVAPHSAAAVGFCLR